MKITVNTLTVLGQGPELYRLRKRFPVVQFHQARKGQIVFLPAGTELCVAGSSRLSGCLEVLCGRQSYHMFKVDLCGPWAEPMAARSTDPRPIAPGRIAMAAGASA